MQITLSLIGLMLLSCQDIRQKLLPAFSVNIPAISLTIGPIRFVSEKEIPIGALRTHINMDSTIKANTAGAFGADDVQSVKVKKLVVKLSNADDENNFSNFESARMKLFSNNDTSAVDIAVIQFPDTYSDSVTVEPTNSPEISNYLRGSELAYNLYWKNRRPTTKPMKLTARITLSVK